MMMYDMSRQYHAERIMSGAERRRATRSVRVLRGLRASGATISG